MVNNKVYDTKKSKSSASDVLDSFTILGRVIWHFLSSNKILLRTYITIAFVASLLSAFSHKILHNCLNTFDLSNEHSMICGSHNHGFKHNSTVVVSSQQQINMNNAFYFYICYLFISNSLDIVRCQLEQEIRPLITSDVRFELYKAVRSRPYSFFLSTPQSDILDKMDEISDNGRFFVEFFTDNIIDLITRTMACLLEIGLLFNPMNLGEVNNIMNIFRALFVFVSVTAMAISSIIIIGFLVVITKVTTPLARSIALRSKSLSEFISKIYDSVNNVYNIKSLSAGSEEDRYIRAFQQDSIKTTDKFISRIHAFKLVVKISGDLINLGLLWHIYHVASAQLKIGMAVGVVSQFRELFHTIEDYINSLEHFISEFTYLIETAANLSEYIKFLVLDSRCEKDSSSTSSRRVIKVFEKIKRAEREQQYCTCGIKIDNTDMSFHNVSFVHSDGTKVIKNLNMTIPQGEKLGIAGTSGSGKSTLFSLSLRLFRPTEGYITLGGEHIENFCDFCFGKHMSIIPQMPILFNRTVKENIAFGSENMSIHNIRDAARRACLDDIIMHFKNNYNFIVGNSGERLSGGQRQRVAIARAMLKNTHLLFIDEATSALDSLTEHQVLLNLYEMFKEKTIISIAHRLHTLKYSDRVIVLERGKIVEEGTFDELALSQGYFHRMWNAVKETND